MDKYGFTIQLPDTWVTTDFTPETFEVVADLLKNTEGGETVASLLDSMKNNRSVEPVLMAFDLNPEAIRKGAAPSVNLIASRNQAMSSLPMEALVPLLSKQLEVIYPTIEILESGTEVLPSGETVGSIQYTLTLEIQAGEPREFHGHQVYLPLEDVFLVLTLSAANEGFEENYGDSFDRIAASFGPIP